MLLHHSYSKLLQFEDGSEVKVELPDSGTRNNAKVTNLREEDRAGIFETKVMLSNDQDQMGPCTC